jgi:hypothetical protein
VIHNMFAGAGDSAGATQVIDNAQAEHHISDDDSKVDVSR